jgi:hypothetical protein
MDFFAAVATTSCVYSAGVNFGGRERAELAGLRRSSLTASGLITDGRRSTRTSHTLRSNAVSGMSRQLPINILDSGRSGRGLDAVQLAWNAKSDQTKVEFNFSSIGGQNESRVNAESQTAAPKN